MGYHDCRPSEPGGYGFRPLVCSLRLHLLDARVQQPEKLPTIGTYQSRYAFGRKAVGCCLCKRGRLRLNRGPNPLISKSPAEGRIARLPELATSSAAG
ncbi:hypothetical protein BQ8482_280128 [Mesorhizobium delmotii]|uniref:Uncharacterized protein n=1 Tax=Mesorhizobium delmotii TaxID=1631247 RepID=A0A2P9AMN4_9HYPH|nr:hypothetical protein BQ8482_280128 [Mesorhizobium delmotii]